MNQNPEQLARDRIDQQLTACGWMVQNKSSINLHARIGVAVREYKTDVGPADYIFFVDKKPVGIIEGEAKRAEEGVHLTMHEEQSLSYAESKLKFLNNDPLPLVYESTGKVTRFTNYGNPKLFLRNTSIQQFLHILHQCVSRQTENLKISTNTNYYDQNCSHSRFTLWLGTRQVSHYKRQIKTGTITWSATYCSKS